MIRRVVALVAVAALFAACGGDDDWQPPTAVRGRVERSVELVEP